GAAVSYKGVRGAVVSTKGNPIGMSILYVPLLTQGGSMSNLILNPKNKEVTMSVRETSHAERVTMVERHLAGETLQAIADDMGCSYYTVRKWWRRYKKEGWRGLEPKPKGAPPRRLTGRVFALGEVRGLAAETPISRLGCRYDFGEDEGASRPKGEAIAQTERLGCVLGPVQETVVPSTSRADKTSQGAAKESKGSARNLGDRLQKGRGGGGMWSGGSATYDQ
ncbi:MAG: helix-turn-helix domain-containing protein, partial [Caldilineae bacterium]